MTELEAKFMQELEKEAYGGTLFMADINPDGMNKAQKSGVVSSLSKKRILISSDDEYQQIGIFPENAEDFDAEFEINKGMVREAIVRAS